MKKQKSFTLVEVTLYVAIVATMLAAMVMLAWGVINNGVKSSVQQEVAGAARFISERIKYEIRNARDVNSVGASINLASFTPALDPVVIDLVSGRVRITQGTGTPVDLNSGDVVVTGLTFVDNRSADGRTKNISFDLTVATTPTGSSQVYRATVNLRSSAEVRSN